MAILETKLIIHVAFRIHSRHRQVLKLLKEDRAFSTFTAIIALMRGMKQKSQSKVLDLKRLHIFFSLL